MKGFIVYGTYRIVEEKPQIHLFGRLDNGESFLAKVHGFRPYFYIPKKDLKKALKVKEFEHEEVDLVDFSGTEVIKVILNEPSEVPELRKAFQEEGIASYEADIRFVQRFFMDNDILGTIEVSGDYIRAENVDRVYGEATVKPAKPYKVSLKTISLDIETDVKATEIYSIALYGDDVKEVHYVSPKKTKGGINYTDEASLLRGLIERMNTIDPDIIVGWNVVNFDLKIISQRLKFHEIQPSIGRNSSEMRIRIQKDFFRESTANIPGRIVFDGIDLVKQAFMSFDNFKLDTVAEDILGKKKVQVEEGFYHNMQEILKKSPKKVVDYNLKDAKLVLEILEKKKLIDLNIKRALITGLQLDRVKGSIAALDSLYIRRATKRGYVVPNSAFGEREERIKGAYVMTPKPGIYDNVVVLDFKSLYPSIIRTYNIDPIAMSKDGEIVAPNRARFRNDEGILGEIILAAWKERDKSKQQGDDVRSYAIKIIMNSFYGVLANPNCRFYSLEMGNAITSFARETIKTTAKIIESMGYNVLYGDTDSVFVDSASDSVKKAEKIGNEITKKVNEHFRKEVKEKYDRECYLELEADKMFKVLLLPTMRSGGGGAKKRYAGLLSDGSIKVTGLEIVRRDWTEIAKEVQQEMLDRVFHKRQVSKYIKRIVEEVRAGKHDEKLILRKALRKDVDEYTKTTPPHVKAAKMLPEIKSNIIEYYITVNGPEPVEMRKSKIDYEFYVEKQIKPIAQSILELYGMDFEDLFRNSTQTSLSGF